MSTEIIKLDSDRPCADGLHKAAAGLAAGKLVAFPTETVYGVAANAANEAAVRNLRELKKRAPSQPFTVHIGRREALDQYVPTLTGVGRRHCRRIRRKRGPDDGHKARRGFLVFRA